MKKLSIIIPVYNTEKYLERCLDSVIYQTFKDIEIIIVNDASSDDSQKIINEYQKKDSRIISIINDENINLGLTRNIGIEKATGEYITFVDSDDWLEKEMYEEMMNLIIENKADIVECNFRVTNENISSSRIKSLIPYFKKTTTAIDEYIIHLSNNELGVSVWNKIYRAEIIKNNNIKFEDNRKIFCEDLFFNLNVMHYANSIITINKPLYNYFVRPESLSQNNDFITLEKIITILNKYVENNENFKSFEKDFSTFSIMIIPFIKFYILNKIQTSKNPVKNGVEILKKIRGNKLLLKSLKNFLKNRNASFKDGLFCLLIILRMYYFILNMILTSKKIKSFFRKM